MTEIYQNHKEDVNRQPNSFSRFMRASIISLFVVLASTVSAESNAAKESTMSNADFPGKNTKKPKTGMESDSVMFKKLSEIFSEFEKAKTESQLAIFMSRYEPILRQYLKIFNARLQLFSAIYEKTKDAEAMREIEDYKRFIAKIEAILKTGSE